MCDVRILRINVRIAHTITEINDDDNRSSDDSTYVVENRVRNSLMIRISLIGMVIHYTATSMLGVNQNNLS